jgi:hypothetical protein
MSEPEKMSHQELVDYVVAVALGEGIGELPSAEKLMADLCHDEPIATETITWAIDPADLDPESYTQYLEGHSDQKRITEIENGAILTPEELSFVIKAATMRDADSGVFDFYRYYRVTDSKDRSVYFSERSGDDLGSSGPSSNHEGPLLSLPYETDTDTQQEDGTVNRFCIID